MLGWFFVKAAPFSMPFFLQPLTKSRSPCHGLALTHQPAIARLLLKTTSTQEGWRLGCFVNKATDG